MEPETRTLKPRRSLFGCLFSGSMGCGAFLFGAVVSAALFAPTMLGDVVAKWIETGFSRTHDGRLVIENLELSWAGGQSANGVKLLDQEGETIVVFNARTPSLLTQLGFQDGPGEWELDVQRARLEIDANGVLNLNRALADRGRPFDWLEHLDGSLGGRGGPGSNASGRVAAGSLTVVGSDGVIVVADLRQALEPVVIEDLHAEVCIDGGERRFLDETILLTAHADFAEGGTCALDLTRSSSHRDWRGTVAGEGIPTRLLGSLHDGRGRLHALLGPRCGVELVLQDSVSGRLGDTRVTGSLDASGAVIRWAFQFAGGTIESLVGVPSLQFAASEPSLLTGEIMRWLFPWLQQGVIEDTAGGVAVDVDRLTYTHDMGLSSLNARLSISPGAAEYPPIRAVSDSFGALNGHSFKLDQEAPIVLEIESGAVRYNDLQMSIDEHSCTFRGQHLIDADRIELEIDVPLNFVGRRLLNHDAVEMLMASDATVSVQLAGTWRDPELNINLAVLQEAVSVNFKAALGHMAKEGYLKTIEAFIPKGD